MDCPICSGSKPTARSTASTPNEIPTPNGPPVSPLTTSEPTSRTEAGIVSPVTAR